MCISCDHHVLITILDIVTVVTSSDLELLDDLSKSILEGSSQVVDEWRREERCFTHY